MQNLNDLPFNLELTYEEEEILGINYPTGMPGAERIKPVHSTQRNKQKRALLKVCYVLRQSNENTGKMVGLSAKTLVRRRKCRGIEDLVQERKHSMSAQEANMIITGINNKSFDYAFEYLQAVDTRKRVMLWKQNQKRNKSEFR